MARMIAELKESGALPQDRPDEAPQRQAALPDEQRRAPPSAGEPDDFTDCDRCPQMSIVEATDIAPSPGARRPLPTRTLAISKSEVTVAEWNACVEDGACRGFREYGASSQKPILDVTRSEALDYASWLSRKSGKIYRPMKTGGWNRGNSGSAADNARADCLSGDSQRWTDDDCDASRGQRGGQRGYRPGGSGGFRVARTLSPDG
jgi:formylglycine-generating enzyme required for sulfatase activity